MPEYFILDAVINLPYMAKCTIKMIIPCAVVTVKIQFSCLIYNKKCANVTKNVFLAVFTLYTSVIFTIFAQN